MTIRMNAATEGVRVWLSGELDHHAARTLREQIDAAVERTGAQKLTLDFTDISFMDSSGIGLVMGRFRLMQTVGGTMTVTGTDRRIRKMMSMAGIDKLGVLEAENHDKTAQ